MSAAANTVYDASRSCPDGRSTTCSPLAGLIGRHAFVHVELHRDQATHERVQVLAQPSHGEAPFCRFTVFVKLQRGRSLGYPDTEYRADGVPQFPAIIGK